MAAAMDFSALVFASVPPPIAGQSLATVMLLDHFERVGLEHRVVDISREFHTGLASRVRRAVSVLQLPARALRERRRLVQRPVVFYLQLGGGLASMLRDLPILELAHRIGSPIVAHVHGAAFRPAFDAAPAPVRAAVRRAVGRVAHAVVLGESLRSLFDGLIEPNRISVIPNGVARDLERSAAAVPPPSDGLTVLYLSNLMREKGYLEVLEAARISQKRALPHRFVLAGQHTETTSADPADVIRRHDLENVRWLGPIDGQAKLDALAGAHALVLPTAMREGQPLAVLEAMHFGLPVVTSHSGGLRDLVEDGTHGIVVPPRDPHAMVAALEKLRLERGLWDRIARHNRAEARLKFTPAAHGDAVVRVIGEVANAA